MTNQIEVNKYEGHTPADAWRHADGSVNYNPPMNNTADVELIADAPLLLAEVKRLRKELAEVEYRLEMAEDVLGRSDWNTIYREIIDEVIE